MKTIAIQLSPEAGSAYFKHAVEVAQAEFTQCMGDTPITLKTIAGLQFFLAELSEDALVQVSRLSFVQGLYEVNEQWLRPLEIEPGFLLHDDFVFGSKYKGKTNERLTQLLINVGLSHTQVYKGQTAKLLDPMCGRGTTVIWAMRYGLNGFGIEQDTKALSDIRSNLKKWTKLNHQKHKILEGSLGAGSKKQQAPFLEFQAEEHSARFAIGDSRQADVLFPNEKFDLIVSDIPYGVQHVTTEGTRNPLYAIEESIAAWSNVLKQKSTIVLSFNSKHPRREQMVSVFEAQGFQAEAFSAPHRMSESIVRDIVVFKRQ
ncbi:MAG: hypothetical protein P8X74_01665 [Reinekea sp.]